MLSAPPNPEQQGWEVEGKSKAIPSCLPRSHHTSCSAVRGVKVPPPQFKNENISALFDSQGHEVALVDISFRRKDAGGVCQMNSGRPRQKTHLCPGTFCEGNSAHDGFVAA